MKYYEIRDTAWKVLINAKIKELPVNLSEIANLIGAIIVEDSKVHLLNPGESGKTVAIGEEIYIVYNDEEIVQRCRFTVAHEIGHVVLGHFAKYGYNLRSNSCDRPEIEKEADMFAARLLMPVCVLNAIHADNPEKISKVCDVTTSAAKIRAERMNNVLIQRQKYLTSPLERQVFSNFKGFIDKYNC